MANDCRNSVSFTGNPDHIKGLAGLLGDFDFNVIIPSNNAAKQEAKDKSSFDPFDTWGTRQSYNVEIEEHDDDHVEYKFDTDWAPPIKIYEELPQFLRDNNLKLNFDAEYSEPNHDIYGVIEASPGGNYYKHSPVKNYHEELVAYIYLNDSSDTDKIAAELDVKITNEKIAASLPKIIKRCGGDVSTMYSEGSIIKCVGDFLGKKSILIEGNLYVGAANPSLDWIASYNFSHDGEHFTNKEIAATHFARDAMIEHLSGDASPGSRKDHDDNNELGRMSL